MVKLEKFDHLNLVYHFTVPLMENFIFCAVCGVRKFANLSLVNAVAVFIQVFHTGAINAN